MCYGTSSTKIKEAKENHFNTSVDLDEEYQT